MRNRLGELVADAYRVVTHAALSRAQRWQLLRTYVRVVVKRFFHGRVSVFFDFAHERVCGFNIAVHRYDDFFYTFREIFIEGDYYVDLKKSDPFIVDLGGNIGVSVIFFKWLYPEARMLVFEPLPENAAILKQNIERTHLKDVELVAKAIAAQEGTLAIYGDRRAASIHESFIEDHKKKEEYADKRVQVPVTTLSRYLKDRPPVDLLKMDIEGAEGEVIRELAASGCLRSVYRIAMEYHHYSLEENTVSELAGLLEKQGFDVFFWSDFRNLARQPKRSSYVYMLFARQRGMC